MDPDEDVHKICEKCGDYICEDCIYDQNDSEDEEKQGKYMEFQSKNLGCTCFDCFNLF